MLAGRAASSCLLRVVIRMVGTENLCTDLVRVEVTLPVWLWERLEEHARVFGMGRDSNR